MNDSNHPIKASAGSTVLVAIVVSLFSDKIREHESFTYAVSVLTSFMVWGQNWCWINGSTLYKSATLALCSILADKKVKIVLNDPHVSDDDKLLIQQSYSKAKTEEVLAKLTYLKGKHGI